MRSKLLLVVVAVMFLAADQAQTDREKFQGTWIVEAATKSGKSETGEKLAHLRVVVEGDNFILKIGDKDAEKSTITLDPAKMPKALDLQTAAPATEKRPVLGIYELSGDTLKLCWRKNGKERPTDFEPKAEDRDLVIMTLKREKK